jgi:hypothetical protein
MKKTSSCKGPPFPLDMLRGMRGGDECLSDTSIGEVDEVDEVRGLLIGDIFGLVVRDGRGEEEGKESLRAETQD